MNELEFWEEVIVKIKETLIPEVNPYIIYVFGSAAKGELRTESDIDIAFLSDKDVTDYERFKIAQILAERLKREVDLVDMEKASTVFKPQIIYKGEVVYCTDESRRRTFEMIAFKEYALLNEERAEILRGIRERGSVYD